MMPVSPVFPLLCEEYGLHPHLHETAGGLVRGTLQDLVLERPLNLCDTNHAPFRKLFEILAVIGHQ